MSSKSYRSLEELNKIAAIGVVEDSGVDSSSKYIKVFPGKVEYSTVNALCDGQAGQSSGSKSTTNDNVISIANIGSGYVAGNFRIGELINLSGPGGMITFGIPSSGIVGSQPYMVMDRYGLYGGIGDSDDRWFYVNYSGESVTANGKVISGGDLFIGSALSYLFWDHSKSKLTLYGDFDIAGNITSVNWNPDWLTDPPMTGYKLDWTSGNAYFAGAVVSGSSTIGGRLATTVGGAINVDGNFTNDVINTSLNTQSRYILKLFDVKNTTQTLSGFRSGTLEWNSSGEIISGYGVAMTPFGLVGGVTVGGIPKTTFSISALNGDATFGGILVAASGTFGTITAGSLGGSLTVGNRLATTIGGAIDADGKFINDIDIPGKLKTSTGEILKVFDVKATTQALSGFRAGDLVWNSSGVRTSGKGIAMTPYGIIGHDGTNPTFSINIDGTATFAGTLSAGISISSPIITGGKMILNNETEKFIQLRRWNGSSWYDVVGFNYAYAAAGGTFSIDTDSGGLSITDSAGPYGPAGSFSAGACSLNMRSNILTLTSNVLIHAEAPITQTKLLIPYTDNSYNLGSPSYRWSTLYTGHIQFSSYSTNPSGAIGKMWHFDNGSVQQFRGCPWNTSIYSFDMTAI